MKKQSENLSVRELTEPDIPFIVDYWTKSSPEFLLSLGVDLKKVPSSKEISKMLLMQLQTPLLHKKAYCVIWEINDIPSGHSNVNPLAFGNEASMHLHFWNAGQRRKGMGSKFIKMSLSFYFEKLKLKKLICEPYALNPAPNRTLAKAGFTFVKEYITTPGSLNFEQAVNRWEITKENYYSGLTN